MCVPCAGASTSRREPSPGRGGGRSPGRHRPVRRRTSAGRLPALPAFHDTPGTGARRHADPLVVHSVHNPLSCADGSRRRVANRLSPGAPTRRACASPSVPRPSTPTSTPPPGRPGPLPPSVRPARHRGASAARSATVSVPRGREGRAGRAGRNQTVPGAASIREERSVAVLDERGAGGRDGGFDRKPRSAGTEGARPEFDRQPPQDIPAEQSVLGAILLSKDAIADTVELLKPDDFYRPAHQTVYECVLDLYGRGEPADPVTVSAELERRGELLRIGGAPYLHTLIAAVPTAANAALLRRDRGRPRDPAPARRGRHPDRAAGLPRRRGRRHRRHRRPRPGRGVRGDRPAGHRGLRRARGRPAADDGRDRRHRLARRGVVRGADGVRRPRRGDQRPARRADGDRGREARHREIHSGTRFCSLGEHQARPDQLRVLAGDEPHRDRHAHALGRGEDPAGRHARRHDDRRRLDAARPPDERDLRGAACSSTTRPT